MIRRVAFASVALLTCALPADAQIRAVQGPPQGWFSGYAGRFMDFGVVLDPDPDGSRWVFGEAWAFGAAYHHVLAPGLVIGADVSYAAPRYERRGLNTNVAIPGAAGTAGILTPMASGRFNYGGGGLGVSFYLTGGIGAMIYRIPDLDRWDPDLALNAGTGIEYLTDNRRGLFLEWGRFWVYHQGQGLESNRANHSLIRLGARIGR
jgi:hypothetical protein